MYVRLQTSHQIVTLPDDFLTLKKVEGDELTFEVRYLFDQETGVKNNITGVLIEVATENPPPPSLPQISGLPGGSVSSFIRSILTQRSRHAQLISSYLKNSILASVVGDPTAFVNNEVVTLFNRGYTTSQLPQLFKKKLVPVRVADAPAAIKPIHAQHDLGDLGLAEREIAEELLLRGADPSDAYALNDLGQSLAESYGGTHKKSPVVFDDETQKLLYKYKNLNYLKPLFQPSAGDPGVPSEDAAPDLMTLHKVLVEEKRLDIRQIVKFRLPSSSTDRLLLNIKTSSSKGAVQQVLSRVFYPREYVKYYFTPTLPPLVKATGYASKAYATLAIKQVDPSATSVRVYKRVYNHHEVNDDAYTAIGEFNLNVADGWKYFPVHNSLGNTYIYRVVAIGRDGAIGTDYSSFVVKPKGRASGFKRTVITTKSQLDGVLLEITKLPSDCVSFQIYREDITIDPGTKEPIDTPQRTESSDVDRVYTMTDSSVKQGHVYAYYCRVFRKNGSHEERRITLYEHVKLVENLVDTKIVNPTLFLTDDGYDVQFKINTTVVNTKVDQIKQLLERQGLLDLFSSEVKDVRDKLTKLIAHNVKRVDLTTGVVEDFGTIDTEDFSDLTARNVASVSELASGRKYRYVVTALLRSPESLLEDYVKVSRDSFTSREYSYKPFKFLHPIVAQRGNLVTVSSIRSHYSKDPMTFGEIGNFVIAEVALDKERSYVADAVREKRGTDVDVLRWNLIGTSKDVDHFQIIAEHGGKKSIIGKSTCIPEVDNFQYIRKLEHTDVGMDIRYFVRPVYYDFVRGPEAMVSNVASEEENR